MLDGECFFHDKEVFCFKNPFFAKNAIFSKIMSQSKELFGLTQSPYISNHISRNGWATIKASRKTAHDKVFLFWGKKAIFSQKMAAPSKNFYSPKYVYSYHVLMYERWLVLKVWYTGGRPTLSPFNRLIYAYACESNSHITIQLTITETELLYTKLLLNDDIVWMYK